MLNEKPKKIKDYSNPTKMRRFWRIQKECLRRAVTPALMYLFTSLLAFACQAITGSETSAVEIVLGAACIAGGAAFNAHLMYHFGKFHYDSYLTGCLHRRNAIDGISSGGDHREEKEYRFWKGPYIGFLIGVPVLFFGVFAIFWTWAELALMMISGWAIFPIQWIRASGVDINGGWSLLFILLPVIISAIFYYLGAMKEKRLKEEETSRQDTIADLAKANADAEKKRHEQTEEQRRKTLLSKKKK